jgi:hypothetical protein
MGIPIELRKPINTYILSTTYVGTTSLTLPPFLYLCKQSREEFKDICFDWYVPTSPHTHETLPIR